MVLWTSGLNKIRIVNFLFTISLLMMLLQLLFTTAINPKLLNFLDVIKKFRITIYSIITQRETV